MLEGDYNTKYFHITTIIHRNHNSINHFKLSDGTYSNDHACIGDEFVSYFAHLFDSSRPVFPPNLDNLFEASTTRENSFLTVIPSYEEIRSTVFMMNSYKSPGPDGFSPLFSNSIGILLGILLLRLSNMLSLLAMF